MKKIFIILCLVLTITFYGCKTSKQPNTELPPVSGEGLPETPSFPEVPEEDLDEEEEKKKKYYIVSSVDSLRVRGAPNNFSAVLGYLDKNDALEYVEKKGDYY